MVKKIAPSVVWFDDIFVTTGGPNGVGVIAGWQVGKNAGLVVFSSKNSHFRNSLGRKQLSFLQALLQRGLHDR